MPMQINIHPRNAVKYEGKVGVDVYGVGEGQCLWIQLEDNRVVLHYGDDASKDDFLRMMKEAFEKIEIACPICGKE